MNTIRDLFLIMFISFNFNYLKSTTPQIDYCSSKFVLKDSTTFVLADSISSLINNEFDIILVLKYSKDLSSYKIDFQSVYILNTNDSIAANEKLKLKIWEEFYKCLFKNKILDNLLILEKCLIPKEDYYLLNLHYNSFSTSKLKSK